MTTNNGTTTAPGVGEQEPGSSVHDLSQALAKAAQDRETRNASREGGDTGVRETPPSITPPGDSGTPDSRETQAGAGQLEGKETSPDPLAALKVEDILKHPVLGSQLQAWSDKAAVSQINAAKSRWQQEYEPEVRSRVEQEATESYLTNLDPRERAELLESDPQMAVLWGKMQERNQSQAPDEAAVTSAAMVYTARVTLESNNQLMEAAGLSPEDRAEVAPEKFADKGLDGLSQWTVAVYNKILTREAEKQAQKALDEKWEAYRTEQEAKGGLRRPNILVRGSNVEPVPELLEGSSMEQLSNAFAKKDRR